MSGRDDSLLLASGRSAQPVPDTAGSPRARRAGVVEVARRSGRNLRSGWLAVTVPGFAVGVLLNALLDNARKVAVHTPAYAVFFLGLAAVLALTARLARAGRTRRAWWTGILGATAAADVAVLLPLLRIQAPSDEALHVAYAPLWLFTALLDSGFGLPHPTGMEIFTIGDVTEPDPFLFLIFTGLALGAILARGRQAAATHAA
jgi:hypothetical protein